MQSLVFKFGGTSMGTPDSIGQCADIVAKAAKEHRVCTVVSALGGITNQLIELIDITEQQKTEEVTALIDAIETRHKETLAAFTGDQLEAVWNDEFAPLFERLRIIATGIAYVGDVSDRSRAVVCSYGERLSSRIMVYALQSRGLQSQRVCATELIVTDSVYCQACLEESATQTCIENTLPALLEQGISPVIPGFIGKDCNGDITLLGGRGGSDYTAAIIGMGISAERVEIWTDVDGVMSADPRAVENVVTWDTVDLSVMSELSHGGAKVLHPKTITAAVSGGIPVVVRNTFNPDAPGTTIIPEETQRLVKGIAVDKGQSLITITEPGMLAGLGFIRKVSETFERNDTSIDVCCVSEITVSISLETKDITDSLLEELSAIGQTTVQSELAKVCVIGNNLTDDASILDTVFRTVSKDQIHAVSVSAAGSNITLMVESEKAQDMLTSLHTALFSS